MVSILVVKGVALASAVKERIEYMNKKPILCVKETTL
jgi:hypothetical protein